MDQKDTNPKDAIGQGKVPLHLIPSTAKAHMAMAFLEGALKYGKYNWRVSGVRSSIYLDALQRHVDKWANGEEVDPTTKVHHLASAMACLAILIDAQEIGKLVDDRPPRADVSALLDGLAEQVLELKELFRDHTPHQHTIKDE